MYPPCVESVTPFSATQLALGSGVDATLTTSQLGLQLARMTATGIVKEGGASVQTPGAATPRGRGKQRSRSREQIMPITELRPAPAQSVAAAVPSPRSLLSIKGAAVEKF